MKKLFVAAAMSVACTLSAQEYKLAKSSGRLEIHLGKVEVEGHGGNEIIFSSRDHKDEKDERAEGLRAINSMGLEDNTGLGINVKEEGNVVSVYQLKKTNSPDVKILVPKGMIVAFEHESQYGGEAKFRNLENEIEISAQYNSVELENISGPLTAKTIYGHVEATFGQNIKGPISIVSIYGYVDVALPVAIKANIRLETSYGEILVAPDFKIEVETQGRDSDKVTGKINGGGISIDLSCNYGKVYLRKK